MNTDTLNVLSEQMAEAVAAIGPSVVQVHGRRRPVSGVAYSKRNRPDHVARPRTRGRRARHDGERPGIIRSAGRLGSGKRTRGAPGRGGSPAAREISDRAGACRPAGARCSAIVEQRADGDGGDCGRDRRSTPDGSGAVARADHSRDRANA